MAPESGLTATIHDLAEHRRQRAFDAWGEGHAERVRREIEQRMRRRQSQPDGEPPEAA